MKIKLLKAVSLLTVTLFLSGISYSQKNLFTVVDGGGSVPDKFDSVSMGPKLKIKFDNLVFSDVNNTKFKIYLPDFNNSQGVPVIVTKKKLEKSTSQFAWYGEIKEQPGSFVLFTRVNDVFSGQVRTNNNKVYNIEYIGNDVHRISTIEQRFFKPDLVLSPPVTFNNPERNINARESAEACCDSGVIDVLVVYTKDVRDAAGGTDGIVSQIFQSRNITNESFLNSNIPVRIEIAGSEMIEYTESGSLRTDREALQDSTDGLMDNIHSLRNELGADVVVLLVENSGSESNTGIAYIMESVSPSFESLAFSVVRRNAAYINLSLPHELGHILGARHECNMDPNITPFPYSHGYSNASFSTIMSKNSGVVRVEYWSDPAIVFPRTGEATGRATGNCQANDAECLRQTIFTVSKFRCKQGCQSLEVRSINIEDLNPPQPEPRPSNLNWLWIIIASILIIGIIIWAVSVRNN